MEVTPGFYAACLENFYGVIRDGVKELYKPKRPGTLPMSWEVLETVFDDIRAVLIEDPKISFPVTLSQAASKPDASYGVQFAFKAMKTQITSDIFEIDTPAMIVEVFWPKSIGTPAEVKALIQEYAATSQSMFDQEHGVVYLPLQMISISYTRN